jgi:hypothetical protein
MLWVGIELDCDFYLLNRQIPQVLMEKRQNKSINLKLTVFKYFFERKCLKFDFILKQVSKKIGKYLIC